jgi:hypothetical protein
MRDLGAQGRAAVTFRSRVSIFAGADMKDSGHENCGLPA